MKKHIVILGGGTAGFYTALYMNKILPTCEITLIRDVEIGIVGVGEATTPHFSNSLVNFLGLNIFEILKETNGSIKNGIKFVNWNGDGQSYFHPFGEWISNFSVENIWNSQSHPVFLQQCISKGKAIKDYSYAHRLSEKNQIDLFNLGWALHFDAALMARYLEKKSLERGINIIDEKYKSANFDSDDYIESLNFESGNKLNCDFVFDCSGFRRELIGKLFKEKWHSYKKYLPMNTAIPFWLDTEILEPYTTSTAMKNGWMWKIPLPSRTGLGYIFDNNYITVEQAKNEVEEYLNQSIEIRKIIEFDAGKFENVWVKNCMAIGLSSNFLEPLESTSLWLTVSQLETVKDFINDIFRPNNLVQKSFNEIISTNVDECMYFIYLHYMTKRNDSEFWKNFRLKHAIPEKLKTRMQLLENNLLKYFDIKPNIASCSFSLSSYYYVSEGLGLISNPNSLPFYDVYPTLDEYQKMIIENQKNNAYEISVFLDDIMRK